MKKVCSFQPCDLIIFFGKILVLEGKLIFAAKALEIAICAYVMENERIVIDGPAEKAKKNPDIKEFYLGLG